MLNRSFMLLFLLMMLTESLHSQQDYFQQEVNYIIDATLNDAENILDAKMQIEYINNSPDDLTSILFHLWPNAYSDRNTAFARQKINTNNDDFFFADEEDLGGFNALDFSSNGKILSYESYEGHKDVAILNLEEALKSGQSIRIDINFQLDVPASFSRLGHVGDSYQMTQWYPKPAVYDREGWHAMPYLDMGEFYSEFGSFDVSITLPDNYVVGATGQLITESEKAFLKDKMQETQIYLDSLQQEIKLGNWSKKSEDSPASSETMKTIRYQADQVHDFAWFADKEFKVVGDKIQLASGREVETYVMFTEVEENLWKDAITYVNRSVAFYSDKVGEYPWPHATAIQSALSAGAGMEYPMITVIGVSNSARSLDRVITHEVGHNWFYGILGTNERMHAWMDEGINSYYENRYMDTYWESSGNQLPDFITKGEEQQFDHLGYKILAKSNAMQPPSMDSEKMWQGCYWLGSYVKVPYLWSYLDAYVGEEAVDSMMHAYYETWKFKHPSPEDLQLVMENHSPLEFDWIFEHGMAAEDPMDYKITAVSDRSVTIKNNGVMDAPVHLVAFKGDEVVAEKWMDGFDGTKEVKIDLKDADRVHIDPFYQSPDLVRSNNDSALRGILKRMDKPGFRMLTGVDRDRKGDIYMVPVPAGNVYEGFMLAPMLHNYEFPPHRLKFMLMPFVGFKRGTISGMADVKLNNFFRGNDFIRNIEIGYNFKSFIYDSSPLQDDYLKRYRRHAPRISFLFNADRSKGAYSSLTLRYLDVKQEEAQFTSAGDFDDFAYVGNSIIDANYEYNISRAVDPWSLQVNYRQLFATDSDFDRDFSRISMTFNKSFTYDKGRNVRLRLFGGYFISNENRNSFSDSGRAFQLTGNGHELDDAWFDDQIIGRNTLEGIGPKQVVIRDAGFKNAFSRSFSSISGNSNNMMLAANLSADLPVDLPLKLPLKPYFDVAYAGGGPMESTALVDNLWYSGGVAFVLPFDILSIYCPVINSENLKDIYLSSAQDSFFKQISFSLKLDLLNLDKTLNKLGL
jgi:hypothetical protein